VKRGYLGGENTLFSEIEKIEFCKNT
jgi:hypothetical protein